MANLSALTQIPENTSFLQPTKFTFAIPTLPFLKYFCQTVNLPGVSTSAITVETPFSATYRHGDKLVYEGFSVSVIVDEDLRVWEETYNWLKALTFPKEFPQYIRYNDKQASPYHDAELTINNNANIPNIRVKFFDCHPTSIGGINFNVTDNADTTITTDIQFRYDRFEIERI